ncbi:MAG TPA: hypothetical protein VMQ83_06855 [Gammaproteobacteria bacterium]|nr:hypothetical protein [Gammaproteobacteria bacterium]
MDDRTIELIHGSIDGTNGPDDERELQRLLEASEVARREHEQLRRLQARLAAEPSFDPPAGLHESILARTTRPATGVVPLRPRRAWLGAAVALAATAAGVALLLGRSPELTQLDPSVLAGTIGRVAEARAPVLRFDQPSISGAISLRQGNGTHAIEIDLDAAGPVTILASAAGAPLGIAGFVQLEGEPAEVSEIAGRTRLLHRGSQRYALVLDPESERYPAIDLFIYDGDTLVREGRLMWPADTPPGQQ